MSALLLRTLSASLPASASSLAGATPHQAFVRASGPALAVAPFNVGWIMSDPKIELCDATHTIIFPWQ